MSKSCRFDNFFYSASITKSKMTFVFNDFSYERNKKTRAESTSENALVFFGYESFISLIIVSILWSSFLSVSANFSILSNGEFTLK